MFSLERCRYRSDLKEVYKITRGIVGQGIFPRVGMSNNRGHMFKRRWGKFESLNKICKARSFFNLSAVDARNLQPQEVAEPHTRQCLKYI